MKTALVCGAGGFIGGHLCASLKDDGCFVVGADIKRHEFRNEGDFCHYFYLVDLRDYGKCKAVMSHCQFNEVWQLAADMGGAGFVFTGEHDAEIMHNSAQINLNMLEAVRTSSSAQITKIFLSSSACIYPNEAQIDAANCKLPESAAYPANPDSEYGFEKLFSERMYLAYRRNYGMDCRIARFHNICGNRGCFEGGREKAPAAMCRKVAMAKDGDEVEIWGDGEQSRSFLYITDCLRGIRALMDLPKADFGPINIGSEEMVTINQLLSYAEEAAGKKVRVKHIPGPLGVRARCSDNTMAERELGWRPEVPLREATKIIYDWIRLQLKERAK